MTLLQALCLIPLTLFLELLLEIAVFVWRKIIPVKSAGVPIPGTATSTQTPIYRHFSCADSVLTPSENAPRTLLDSFSAAVKRNPTGPCLGHRPLDSSGNAGGEYVWESYEQCFLRMQNFSAGLEFLGLVGPNDLGMKLIALYSKNRVESILGEYAAYMRRATTIPLYETFESATIEYILNQTELSVIICSDELCNTLIELKDQCQHLRCIIRMDNQPNADLNQRCQEKQLEVYTFNEVEQLGEQHPCAMLEVSPDDVATFSYTSGTTGVPKGAMLSHGNFAAVIAGVKREGIDVYPSDRYLSYLPLAHTFERVVSAYCLGCGAGIGFYQGNVKRIVEDIKAFRPTIFISVPRLFNKVYDGIMAKLNQRTSTKLLVKIALAHKTLAMNTLGTTSHWVWDPLLFHKVAKEVGFDRCRLMACGSAPIAQHVLSFLRVGFACPVLEGYGCTESTALITVTNPKDFVPNHVGGPAPHVEVMLKALVDLKYLPSDRSHKGQACMGRGEICFRGPALFHGYYKLEDQTNDAVDEDGWFHTGDIGVWLSGGRLRVVDRQKNLFKLAQGEYIAPEKVEDVYTESEYVAQAFLYGDSMQNSCVAIIVPDETSFRQLAAETIGDHAEQQTMQELCESTEMIERMLKEITIVGRRRKLNSLEQAKAILLTADQFSTENGLLTPTFKIKRGAARDAFIEQIREMYKALGGVGGRHVLQAG